MSPGTQTPCLDHSGGRVGCLQVMGCGWVLARVVEPLAGSSSAGPAQEPDHTGPGKPAEQTTREQLNNSSDGLHWQQADCCGVDDTTSGSAGRLIVWQAMMVKEEEWQSSLRLLPHWLA